MMKLKDTSVVVIGLSSEMYFAIGLADAAYADEGLECVITAGLDGSHNTGSLHPEGKAVDIRNQQCSEIQLGRIALKLQRLNKYGFDVVNERVGDTEKTTASHFHIEYQPKEDEIFWHFE
jgi:hypothetical protein